MTFRYNGTVVATQEPTSASVGSGRSGAVNGLGQRSLRILVAAGMALAILYVWDRWALYQALWTTVLVVVQSWFGEAFRGAHERRCAVPEHRSPLCAWLVRFAWAELLPIVLSLAEIFLMAMVRACDE